MSDQPLILGVTGHRPKKLVVMANRKDLDDELFDLALYGLEKLKPSTVITGMALGWDIAIADAAVELGIPFWAYIPFLGQESGWLPEQQERYFTLKSKARIVRVFSQQRRMSAYFERNIGIVEDSHVLLALWNGSTDGGTYHAVSAAHKCAKKIYNLWDRWERGDFWPEEPPKETKE